MNVVIDSYRLLSAIGEHRQAFSAIDALVGKHAIAMLTAQLKHRSLELALYREIVKAVGAEPFELFLDTSDDKLLKAIAKKLDPHAAETKEGAGDDLRALLINLGAGRIEPTAQPVKASGSRTKKLPGTAGKGGAVSEARPHAIATKPPGRR